MNTSPSASAGPYRSLPTRPPQKKIPPTVRERQHLLQEARKFVQEIKPVPPLPLNELRAHAGTVLSRAGCEAIFTDYVTLVVNNEIWRERFAMVPFERRLLLLPKCLRVETKCPASFDRLGLICENCGLCPIHSLAAEAEAQGYAVLVAEGSAVVMNLIKSGTIEAVVGVSCLNVLKKAFPHMEAAAVPGIAIPLLHDDCADTSVDLSWVRDYINLTAGERAHRLDLDSLRGEAARCFEPASLEALLGPADGPAEKIARDWLAQAGKRWRPFLTLAVYQALNGADRPISQDLRKIAVAVECFHKASLIHDDIEDNDSTRYGEKTLHEQHGVPLALNAGDLLIGEGYRLLSICETDAAAKVEMLQVASEGQRELCRGQGTELFWSRQPGALPPEAVLDIFRQKTAPAFEVALRLGAIYAGKHDGCREVLGDYSRALGIAYQIRDDLADFGALAESDDITGRRPSLVAALAHTRASGVDLDFLDRVWNGEIRPQITQIESLCRKLGATEQCERLFEEFKEAAVGSLGALGEPDLKGLLRRVVGRIFNEVEYAGWCAEQENFKTLNAAKKNGASGNHS